MPRLAISLALLGIAGVLTGCGAVSARQVAGGRLTVVAGENPWGDLARQIGGAHVTVTSLIDRPNADPHLFQPGTAAGLAVARARVVIVNGAGYDPFMARLLDAAPASRRSVVTVADVLHATGEDANPHFWYDAPRVPAVVSAIGRALQTADPAHAAAYRAGVRRTLAALRPVERAVSRLREHAAGEPVADTERLPGYLLAAAGLRMLTPSGFSRAVENGIDPSFADIATMQDLVAQHRVRALVVNEQAVTPITSRLQSLADDNDVPVVAMTETLPSGTTFEAWQLAQVRALRAAVAS